MKSKWQLCPPLLITESLLKTDNSIWSSARAATACCFTLLWPNSLEVSWQPMGAAGQPVLANQSAAWWSSGQPWSGLSSPTLPIKLIKRSEDLEPVSILQSPGSASPGPDEGRGLPTHYSVKTQHFFPSSTWISNTRRAAKIAPRPLSLDDKMSLIKCWFIRPWWPGLDNRPGSESFLRNLIISNKTANNNQVNAPWSSGELSEKQISIFPISFCFHRLSSPGQSNK